MRREISEETGLNVVSGEWLFANEWKGVEHNYFWCEVGETANVALQITGGPEIHPYPGQEYEPMWIDLNNLEMMGQLRPVEALEYLVK